MSGLEETKTEGVIASTRKTVFGQGFEQAVHEVEDNIRRLYLDDDTPWVIGYSGGKDSSTCLQLVWNALSELPEIR